MPCREPAWAGRAFNGPPSGRYQAPRRGAKPASGGLTPPARPAPKRPVGAMPPTTNTRRARHAHQPRKHHPDPTERHLARARDAGLAHAAHLILTDDETRRVLDEDYSTIQPPDLSGQWADDPTPQSLAAEIIDTHTLTNASPDQLADIQDALADAREAGRDALWNDAVPATAYRHLGHIDDALRLERRNETAADRLRAEADNQRR
jgi:hypothetical protein